MANYFSGWKRRIGVIALGLTCVLAVFWIRSFSTGDAIFCSTSRHWTNGIGSTNGVIFFAEIGDSSSQTALPLRWSQFPSSLLIFVTEDVGEYWNWCGFGIYESTSVPPANRSVGMRNSQAIQRYITVPYWFLAIPLTALSAWLLLSKHRQSTKIEPSQLPAA